MTNVQIFGVKGSAATRAAERFFKERRVPILPEIGVPEIGANDIWHLFRERYAAGC